MELLLANTSSVLLFTGKFNGSSPWLRNAGTNVPTKVHEGSFAQ